MRRLKMFVFLSLFFFLTVSCGGGFKVGEPWNPEHARFFDDGIDRLDDITKLSGKWAFHAEENLNALSSLSDLIALATISTVQTTQTPEGKNQKRLFVQVDKIIYGGTPSESIILNSSNDTKGYALIERHKRQLSGQHLLFVRWFENEDTTIGHHFHIASPSEKNLEFVKNIVNNRLKEEGIEKDKK